VILLGYFILGIVVIQFLFPIFESITSVILTALEVLKGYLATKVARYSRLITEEEDEPKKRPMGFISHLEEDDDE
jgi:hypothetical protein